MLRWFDSRRLFAPAPATSEMETLWKICSRCQTQVISSVERVSLICPFNFPWRTVWAQYTALKQEEWELGCFRQALASRPCNVESNTLYCVSGTKLKADLHVEVSFSLSELNGQISAEYFFGQAVLGDVSMLSRQHIYASNYMTTTSTILKPQLRSKACYTWSMLSDLSACYILGHVYIYLNGCKSRYWTDLRRILPARKLISWNQANSYFQSCRWTD